MPDVGLTGPDRTLPIPRPRGEIAPLLRKPLPPAPRPPARTPEELPPRLRGPRALLAHPRFTVFHRLLATVLIANTAIAIAGIAGIVQGPGWRDLQHLPHQDLARLTAANLALAVLIRNQHVVNLIYIVATNAPTSWPLSIRRALAKVYHLGGIHVGAAIAGTFWLGASTVALVAGSFRDPRIHAPTLVVAQTQLVLLATLCLLATPARRARAHDTFERSHRFGGWAALALFWAQTVLVTEDLRPEDESLTHALTHEWSVALLAAATLSVVQPWLRLRRVRVHVETPSAHVAVARFGYGLTPRVGYGFAISRRPLREWHAFASVPKAGEPGFRMVVSRAGDWTGDFIDDVPTHLWVRGVPTAGMAKVEKLFRRVVLVATGSGIGPCLPFLLSRQAPARLVWSARDPRGTYGHELVDEVLRVQPDAVIWDTDAHGRPDLLALALDAYRDLDAEAVVVVANQRLTRAVVHGLESRGIPAYGAIWDS